MMAQSASQGKTSLRFPSSGASNGRVQLSSPNTANNVDMLLPSALPVSTQFLQSDASGNLSFAAAGGGGSSAISFGSSAGYTLGSFTTFDAGAGGAATITGAALASGLVKLTPHLISLGRPQYRMPTATDLVAAFTPSSYPYFFNVKIELSSYTTLGAIAGAGLRTAPTDTSTRCLDNGVNVANTDCYRFDSSGAANFRLAGAGVFCITMNSATDYTFSCLTQGVTTLNGLQTFNPAA